MNGDDPDCAPRMPPTKAPAYSLATLGVHADDALNSSTDVAPALHVSTTFRYASDPDKLVPVADEEVRDTTIPVHFPWSGRKRLLFARHWPTHSLANATPCRISADTLPRSSRPATLSHPGRQTHTSTPASRRPTRPASNPSSRSSSPAPP